MICKDMVSQVERKQEFNQRNCVFEKLTFSLGIYFYEKDIAKVAVPRCSSK